MLSIIQRNIMGVCDAPRNKYMHYFLLVQDIILQFFKCHMKTILIFFFRQYFKMSKRLISPSSMNKFFRTVWKLICYLCCETLCIQQALCGITLILPTTMWLLLKLLVQVAFYPVLQHFTRNSDSWIVIAEQQVS